MAETSSINFLGSYSGIDRTSIDQLMEVEKLPLVQLSNKKVTLTEKQNAWKDINTRLNTLFEKIKVLQNSDTFTDKKATSSNEGVVSIVASNKSTPTTYKIHVKQLATNSSVISEQITEAYDEETGKVDMEKALNISGTFTIANAQNISRQIDLTTNDSLKDVVNKINNATKDVKDGETTIPGTGISATIIDGRLVLTDSKTGSRDITLSSEDDVLINLKLNTPTDLGNNSVFTVNGVEVSRSSNSVSDVIEHSTINLNKEHGVGEYETVNISLDTEKMSKSIQEFVDQYNSTMTFIESSLDAGNPEVVGSGGVLSGDSTLMRLHSSLRNLVTSKLINPNTTVKDSSQLGITTIDKYGKLQFDSNKLKNALTEDAQNVANFFISKNSENEEIGFAPRLKTYIDSFVSSTDGIILGKTESYDRTLKSLNDQIDRFNLRMEKREEYYVKMFTALDIAMMQAESQMSWLEGQITAMNASTKK